MIPVSGRALEAVGFVAGELELEAHPVTKNAAAAPARINEIFFILIQLSQSMFHNNQGTF